MNITLDLSPATNHTASLEFIFSWIDYSMFGIMLSVSVLIGVYYGCFGKKQDTVNEYLLGGKKMKIFPVAISIAASDTSSIAILSVPADIYVYGAAYAWTCAGFILNGILCSYVFIPVFLKLQIGTIYEYLHLRFDNKIRRLASFLYIISVVIYNPIVIYVPSLAFAQATGINLYIISPIVSIICVFYTTIGGLKAVIWTDTIQTIAIVCSMMAIFGIGISVGGGVPFIWQKSIDGQRLDLFNFQFDPTNRDSFWGPIIGGTTYALAAYTVSQANIQRLMSVPSLTHAKKAVLISLIAIVIVKLATTFLGLIIYSRYSDCDPLQTKQVSRNDQLLPYYVMDVAGSIPGLPGLFIAGVFSAGLSTLSTTLNTLSGIIYDDFILPFMPANTTQKRASNILKLIVVVVGTINTLLVLVVEQLGGILPLVISVTAITGSPLLGLFILGLLIPIANSKGALSGGIIGLIFSSWMICGHQYYSQIGYLEDFAKSSIVEGCDLLVNATMNATIEGKSLIVDEPFFLYRISYWYHNLLGVVVTVLVGVIVSYITRKKGDLPVDRNLLSPVIHSFLPKEDDKPSLAAISEPERGINLVHLNSENT